MGTGDEEPADQAQTGTVSRMPYSRYALLATGVALVGNLAGALTGWPIAILANMTILFVLSRMAIELHKARTPGFDPIVAAETIVAFGVTSLILSLVGALAPLALSRNLDGIASGASLIGFARPFLEGLATAGVAPLAAMVVRNRVAEMEVAADPSGDTLSLSQAISSLTLDIEASRAGVSLLLTSLGALSQSMTEAVGSTRGLAENLQNETGRLRQALGSARNDLEQFGAQAGAAGAGVSEAAKQADRLSQSMAEAGTLLDELAKLIESVERFVAPGAGRPQ